ncbi:MAG: hypothetical protein VW338_00810 [Rhodospirillaceae bacterium]
MTTLSGDAVRNFGLGDIQEYAVIAADIIYANAAVGLVDASGHARPLVGGDRFVGFAELRADNSAGAAAAINVRVRARGMVQLSVSGAVITDIGQPVYATDDDTFVFLPTGGSFIGLVRRFVSSGVVIVEYGPEITDPYAAWPVRETLTGTKTFDAQDCGKAFFVTSAGDNDALTLPAIADGLNDILVVAIDAFGSTKVVIDPAAADNIRAADLAAVDNKDLLLTKATQRRGDCARIFLGDADGYSASLGNLALGTPSIWTAEA